MENLEGVREEQASRQSEDPVDDTKLYLMAARGQDKQRIYEIGSEATSHLSQSNYPSHFVGAVQAGTSGYTVLSLADRHATLERLVMQQSEMLAQQSHIITEIHQHLRIRPTPPMNPPATDWTDTISTHDPISSDDIDLVKVIRLSDDQPSKN